MLLLPCWVHWEHLQKQELMHTVCNSSEPVFCLGLRACYSSSSFLCIPAPPSCHVPLTWWA